MRAKRLSFGHVALVVTLALASTGCSKLKEVANKAVGGDDGGAASSGSGLLSFLGGDFEGTITARASGKSAKGLQEFTIAIKKPKFRIDFQAPPSAAGAFGPSGALILDPAQKKGWMLNAPQKVAMVIDFGKMKAATEGLTAAGSSQPKAPTNPPKIDKTGKTETVAGYSCEVWKIQTTEGNRAEVCAAEGITWFDFSDLAKSSPELAIAAVAGGANHFPLRLVAYNPDGTEDTRIEATKIAKGTIDDAQFSVPADYRTLDMASMLGGLVGGSGAPGAPAGLGAPGALPPGHRFSPRHPPKPTH